MSHVATAPHELEGNLIFVENGLRPYWTLSKLVVDYLDGGGQFEDVELAGERWDVSVGYQKGGIAPRDEDSATERLYEWRVAAYGDGQRKATYLIQPRFVGMQHHETGEQISSPFDHVAADEGVNVRLEGSSNLEPDESKQLLPRILQTVASEHGLRFSPEYFSGTPHEMSNITKYERYLRVRREMARKVVANDGTFMRLMHLLATEEGIEAEYRIDNQEILGYNHRVRLPKSATKKLIPGHSYGKQLKHYHPKHVRKSDTEDPLYHPKIGALFTRKLNSDNSVPWSERHELTKELEETLINVLTWDSVPVQPGSPTFVSDDHFHNRESEVTIGRYDDPTPQLEASQESVLVRTMTNLTDADLDMLDVLATDGGRENHVTELLGDTDIESMSTIYRCLDRMDGLLENQNGNVRWISEKIKQEVREIIEIASEHVETAATAAARVLDMDPEQLKEQGSAFQSWLNRYAVDLLEEDGDLTLKIQATLSRFRSGTDPFIPKVLEYGQIAWLQSGRRKGRFENATVEFAEPLNGSRYWKVKRVMSALD
ncbi:DUF7845 domain-containing protein [Halorussus amylolyticus]|uniref:DUF7845 domain-containing protein n=1 Tax=Halorussus amylolyticus TaxID=1126242 RepID=UPI0010531D9E|nr:MarR family transcriptional regulator [Halorussus amylolyticus]